MKIITIILALALCVFSFRINANDSSLKKFYSVDFSHFSYTSLPMGFRGTVNPEMVALTTTGRTSETRLIELPLYVNTAIVTIYSYSVDQSLFVPQVILLDERFEPIGIVDDELDVSMTFLDKIKGKIEFSISPLVRYIVITDSPQRRGEALQINQTDKSFVISGTGNLSVMLPTESAPITLISSTKFFLAPVLALVVTRSRIIHRGMTTT